ncbi:S-adenosyl-L-methionine-dependent methyltransferase [Gonapodya prolifera JEL478]|uniref:S-adenosyl-L-methionine-dependent methyltransferase n=1 Tax=Gonapodya prolifera (strain JEL478) TaxID=1344416 RepID=A0A139A1A6_GONPJ|nr:S-adenosyl-L-methionine-dependent methyltransferase [Gonapodya prolifera JEL478]|eukprot:KXS10570.1 S-adenosyl-L-methionine-dependent methyltransferase [Gonapodya prolifera JEL478]
MIRQRSGNFIRTINTLTSLHPTFCRSSCRSTIWVPPHRGSRFFTSTPATTQAQIIFDRHVKKLQRDKSVHHPENAQTDYIKDEVAERLVDRLMDIKRRFKTVVDLGAGCGHVVKFLDKEICEEVIQTDISQQMLDRDKDKEYEVTIQRQVVDEENLSFEPDSLDVVLSSLSLHWVNDLPGALIQVNRALKPDGVLLGAMFGGDTLFELRTSLQLAELEREGGLSPHVSPMINVSDIAQLLSRAGFTLTTVDSEEIVVRYPSIFELMEDLGAMGESNAVISRKPFLRRDTLIAASSVYKELYGKEDGSIPATFQVIFLIGWKPSPTQRKPLKPGSATHSMTDLANPEKMNVLFQEQQRKGKA